MNLLIFLMVYTVANGLLAFPEGQLRSHRYRRYLGLGRKFKINRRYQECVGPGDLPGHCKHPIFCAMNVVGSSKNPVEHLCVIEKTFVGVCCPDDILLSNIVGSRIIMDLPAGGEDYDEKENFTMGCGIFIDEKPQQSNAKEWPWLASLYDPESKTPFCGGALITDRHVLTAAHCTEGRTPSDIRVRLGEYDYARSDETRPRNFEISEIKEHEEFELSTYFNDIAILTLANATGFNTYIWPICLPPLNKNYVNETAIVAGWGRISYSGNTSNILRQVEVPVWEHEKCVDSFVQTITEKTLCAAAYEGGKDSCKGDSGGPLLHQLPNGRWVVIGIVSWGIGCGQKGQPGVYTRVDNYIPWIITNTIAK